MGTAVVGSSLTSVGTIATGVWNGTAVVSTYGGTGLASYTAGDILYYASGTTLTKLAKGTAGQALKMNSGATAPEWGASGGGAHTIQEFTSQSSGTDPSITAGTNAKIYVKYVDANNDGLFIKLKKNASATVVQIA